MNIDVTVNALERVAESNEHTLDDSFINELTRYGRFLSEYGVSHEEFHAIGLALGVLSIEKAEVRFVSERHLENARLMFGCSKANNDCHTAASIILGRRLSRQHGAEGA